MQTVWSTGAKGEVMTTDFEQGEFPTFCTMAKAIAAADAEGIPVDAYDRLREKCQSPAEVELLRILQKGYRLSQVQSQVHIGRYRLDFVTSDGVGWEVDGRNFPDADRDRERDRWLLATGRLSSIIRLPAAVAWYYWDACMAVFGLWSEYRLLNPSPVLSAEQVRAEWQFTQDPQSECREEWLQWASEASAYEASEFVAEVGRALAFIDGWREDFSKVDAYRLATKLQILRRTPQRCD